MSGNGSADVSVPTDLTVTSHADSEEDYAATRRSGQVKVDFNLKFGSSILMPKQFPFWPTLGHVFSPSSSRIVIPGLSSVSSCKMCLVSCV